VEERSSHMRQSRPARKRVKLLATLAMLALLGTVVSTGTWSAFSATTSNSGSSLAAAAVSISDNDAGAAMLLLAGAQPGARDTGCIQVTYNGSAAATVRLYGTTTGTGLDPYLDLVVTRGTISAGAFDSCASFTADSTVYITGQPAGVVYAGTLAGFPDDYTAGVVDPTASSPESWTSTEVHAYKFQLTVGANSAAQGKAVTQTFTWEARNT